MAEREMLARLIFDKAVGIQHWDNDFYLEERMGCFRTADAILAAGFCHVPEGHIVVPLMPTQEMMFAGAAAERNTEMEKPLAFRARIVYRAMLAAAEKKP